MDKKKRIDLFNDVLSKYSGHTIETVSTLSRDDRMDVFNEVVNTINDQQNRNLSNIEEELERFFDNPTLTEKDYIIEFRDGDDLLQEYNKQAFWRRRAGIMAMFDVDPDVEMANVIYSGVRMDITEENTKSNE